MTNTDEYVEKIRNITAETERVKAEMDMASQVQAGILPSTFPAFPGQTAFDVYALMKPARNVGGDFYDFFMTDKDHIALVMADVSDKGMPAALFMVMSKVAINSRALSGGSPSEILKDVNRKLCENNPGNLFVTVWMAIIDIRTGKGLAVNAGHEHPVLKKAGGSYELIEYEHTLMLGMFDDIDVDEHEFHLDPGDRLFVYTDGVPEANDKDGNFYGTDRMLAFEYCDKTADE
ncbi:MAG: PP2C family protein-serine/threonine phosphatase [Eubacterium sp.]|nr:PP2C family protein-serine/threonine phosphatase [Eubacterium sp.]